MLKLRDYQAEAIAEVRRQWESGCKRTLVVAATGCGKSAIFLALLDQLHKENPQARHLIVAGTQELIYQPVEKAQEYELDLAKHMGIVMGEQSDDDALCVVATIQSLSSNGRLTRILQHGPIDYVVLDEAQHSVSSTHLNLLARLGNDPYVLGATATPIRTDKDGLSRVFQSCAYRFTIDKGIERGVLVPFQAFGFTLPITFQGISENEDGWANEPVGDLLKASNILEIVTEKWREYAGNAQTIVFCASVAQAHAQAAFMKEQGIRAAAIDGTTDKTERARILADYKSGAIQVVVNCQVLTEGYDAPQTACICMVSPTKSDLRYVQRLGRGLRPYSGKTSCTVLDFAPRDEREVVFAGDVLGMPRKVVKAQERAESAGIMVSALALNMFGQSAAIDPSEVAVKVLTFMRQTSLAWTYEGSLAVAGLNTTTTLALVLPDSERLAQGEAKRRENKWGPKSERWYQWLQRVHVLVIRKDPVTKRTEAGLAGSYTELADAQEKASEIAKAEAEDILASRKKGWRDLVPTPGQVRELNRLGIEIPATRGQASQLQCVAYAKQAVAKWEERERKAYWGEKGAMGK